MTYSLDQDTLDTTEAEKEKRLLLEGGDLSGLVCRSGTYQGPCGVDLAKAPHGATKADPSLNGRRKLHMTTTLLLTPKQGMSREGDHRTTDKSALSSYTRHVLRMRIEPGKKP